MESELHKACLLFDVDISWIYPFCSLPNTRSLLKLTMWSLSKLLKIWASRWVCAYNLYAHTQCTYQFYLRTLSMPKALSMYHKILKCMDVYLFSAFSACEFKAPPLRPWRLTLDSGDSLLWSRGDSLRRRGVSQLAPGCSAHPPGAVEIHPGAFEVKSGSGALEEKTTFTDFFRQFFNNQNNTTINIFFFTSTTNMLCMIIYVLYILSIDLLLKLPHFVGVPINECTARCRVHLLYRTVSINSRKVSLILIASRIFPKTGIFRGFSLH